MFHTRHADIHLAAEQKSELVHVLFCKEIGRLHPTKRLIINKLHLRFVYTQTVLCSWHTTLAAL